jgi:CcmD family protein
VAGATLLAGLLGPFALAVAQAQEFVKVEDGAREQLPATPFVGAAYGFIWLALLLYVLVVARGLAGVQRELQDLRRRLDRAEGARVDVAPSGRP